VRVVIFGRGEAGAFKELWSVPVDPASPLVDRAPSPAAGRVWAVVENGPPADKVDLLLLGDGYTPSDMDKWHRDAQRMAALLFAVSPFKEHRQDFNVWAVDTPSTLTGVSRPSDGVYRALPSEPPTTPSAPSATCSRSTTRGCAKSRPPRPTSSSRSS
jgi:hypothetical protein